MNITSQGWSLSLDLNGGRVKELFYNHIKIFGTYNRSDGKMGNTHLCVPSFDKEGQEKYDLPFHGLVRNVVWNEERRTKNEVSISVITQPIKSYPASLKVEQRFLLGKEFAHEITVQHISGEAVPVNVGVHYYWNTPDGWGRTTVNSQQSAAQIKENGYIGLQENNNIVFPHATYRLTSSGFHNAVLWTSFKTDELGNKKYSQDFCCIEPVIAWPRYFGREESMLLPGESVSASIRVQKVV